MLHDAPRRPRRPAHGTRQHDRFTMTPNALLDHHAALGITLAEMTCAVVVLRHQYDDRLPFPSEGTIARALGRSVRQVRRYIARLRDRGLLRVVPRFDPWRGQTTNAYDLAPLLRAVEHVAAGLLAPTRAEDQKALRSQVDVLPPRTCMSGHEKDPGEQDDHDAMPPTPTCLLEQRKDDDGAELDQPRVQHSSASPAAFAAAASLTAPSPSRGHAQPAAPGDDAPLLAAALGALSDEFGDETPRSSITRAQTLMAGAGVSLAVFLAALRETAERTRRYQPRVRKQRASDGAANLMPYAFAVLENLLREDVTAPAASTVPARTRREACRRRRLLPAPPVVVAEQAAPPLPDEPHPVWRAVLDELRGVMTPANFTRWFAPTRAVSEEDGLLQVTVPDEHHRWQMEERLRGQVERALSLAGYRGVRVLFALG